MRQHIHQDLSEQMKASFSQSEEVFSKSHITIRIVLSYYNIVKNSLKEIHVSK